MARSGACIIAPFLERDLSCLRLLVSFCLYPVKDLHHFRDLEQSSEELVYLLIGILFRWQILLQHRAMSAETMSTLLTSKVICVFIEIGKIAVPLESTRIRCK